MFRKIKSDTHSEQLLTGVARLLSDTTHKHSDVQLKVGGKIFHCHKLILALKSPYFDKLFQSSPSSSASATTADQEIVLNDVGADDFDKLIQFLYTGEVELTEKNVKNILQAADVLKLEELSKFCGAYLLDSISSSNCIGC